MKKVVYALILECLFLSLVSCDFISSGSENDGTVVAFDAKKYKEIFVEKGPWVYDINFLENEIARVRNDILAHVEKNRGDSWTPEIQKNLEKSLDDALFKPEDFEKIELEFFDDFAVKLSNNGEVMNGYFGYSSGKIGEETINELALFAPPKPGEKGEIKMYGKELNQVYVFDAFQMRENSFTRVEKIQGILDTTFVMTLKYVPKH